ncbi:hypothetical protein BH23BAC1_BH23BAC1_44090 [soil metagenome]
MSVSFKKLFNLKINYCKKITEYKVLGTNRIISFAIDKNV